MAGLKRVLMIVLAVLALAAAAGLRRPVLAQATAGTAERSPGPGNDDVLPALLVEVRGLRAAMEQMAAGSTQAQLLVGRLQLQEGRVTAMIRRLDNVRDSLATARREFDELNTAAQRIEKEGMAGDVPEKDREGLIIGLKNKVAASKSEIDRLSAEEMQLTADIATEQQRWVAINQRLDELERTLAKR